MNRITIVGSDGFPSIPGVQIKIEDTERQTYSFYDKGDLRRLFTSNGTRLTLARKEDGVTLISSVMFSSIENGNNENTVFSSKEELVDYVGSNFFHEATSSAEPGSGSGSVNSVNAKQPDGSGNVALVINDIPNLSSQLSTKVDKIIGSTLLTAQQASDLQALKTMVIPGSADADTVINAFNEVINVFENSPEGFNLAQALSVKLDSATFSAFQTSLITTLASKVDNSRTINGKALNTNVLLNKDEIPDGATAKTFTAPEKTQLESVEFGATKYTDTKAIAANSALLSYKADLQPSVIYSRNYFTDLNDFNIVGFAVAPTIVNGAIRLSSTETAKNDYTQYLTVKNSHSNDEKTTYEVIYKLVAAPNTTTFGISLGRKSTSTAAGGLFSVTATHAPTSAGSATSIQNQDKGVVFSGTLTAPTGVIGDILKLRITLDENKVSSIASNLTSGAADGLRSAVSLLKPTQVYGPPNTGLIALYYHGGVIDILSLTVTTTTIKRPVVGFYGDSKTNGSYAMSNEMRYPKLVASTLNRTIAIFSGAGDATFDMLMALDNDLLISVPQIAVINIGRNDLATPSTLADILARYNTIRTKLLNAGVKRIVNFATFPETAADQTALRDGIINAYPGDININIYPKWDNATMLNPTDNAHPLPMGMRLAANEISNAILNSGLY